MDIVFGLKKVVALFVAPLPMIALGLVLANLLLWRSHGQPGLKWILGLTTAAFLLFSSPIVSNSLIRSLEETYPVYQDTLPNVDNIIVLGCWHREDGFRPLVDNIHTCSLVRLIEAARLAKVYPEAKIILSGFNADPSRDQQFSHPAYSARLLNAIGIADKRLIQVADSRDTHEEARRLQPIVQGDINLLVSSASHLKRAVRLFRQYQINVTPVPARYLSGHETRFELHSFVPSPESLERSERAIYELMGNLWVALNGPDS